MLVENFSRDSTGVEQFALLILLTPELSHVGILYRFDGVMYVLDQCWHERFRCEPADKPYPCVVPNLLDAEFDNIVSACELFVDRNIRRPSGRLPMGFKQPQKARFNAEGELIWDGSVGLTCATFVLAVFDAVRIPLVDLRGWRRRDADDERHSSLLRLMELGNDAARIPKASKEHIERVRAELPCVRVRPEEVAGAALFLDRPVGFDEAERAGLWLRAQLQPGEVSSSEQPDQPQPT